MKKPINDARQTSRLRAGISLPPAPPAKRIHLILLLLLIFGFGGFGGFGLSNLHAQAPRLVVIIVIDQLRSDYLTRFRSRFGPGGFNRLLREGSVFANCQYGYAATATAPSHAVLATGAYPRHNGIVGNSWYDRERGRRIAAAADETYPLVRSFVAGRFLAGSPEESSRGASPWALEGTTLGDELRLSNGGDSRVVAVSMKDRAAVFAGGKNPNAVFWFDVAAEGFLTSSYYTASLPGWLVQFNSDHSLETYAGKQWNPLEGGAFERRLELEQGPEGREKFWFDFGATPFASQLQFDLAEAAVEAYQLGEDQAADLLWIALSSPDYLGHQVGPDSALIEDMFLRIDRQMEEFFSFLDRRVGLQNVILGLSSDHGVAPLPEQAQAARLGGGRIDSQKLTGEINEALVLRFGREDWIESYVFPWIYLNHEAMERHSLDQELVARTAGEAALEQDGVVAYYTAGQLAGGAAEDSMRALYARSYYPGRSGDLALRYAPFFVEAFPGGGTDHGSPYSYDRRVPLILWGSPFRAGVFHTATSPADLAPTLAAVLQINPPAAATGRVLREALLPSASAGKQATAARTEGVPHE
ncbi:MAG: alkaline phosphatase family protein [Acidobacteria bacterium]|nr:alkaline phosphatase family protein [Acidobacteriota bacterium]